MLPCTPQLPAQLYHPPLIQRLQNSNQTKRPKFQGWQEWHSRRQFLAHSWGVEGGREGSWGHVNELWSSQDCKSSNSLAAQPAGPGMGEVTGGQAQQPTDFFSTSSHLPPSSCSPFPKLLFPFLHRQAQGLASHLLWGQLPLPAFHPRHLPTRKVLVNKASVPQPGVHQQLRAQLDYVQPGSPGHFSLKHQIKALHSSSIPPQGSVSFTFTVVCFPINNIPTPPDYFLKHLV